MFRFFYYKPHPLTALKSCINDPHKTCISRPSFSNHVRIIFLDSTQPASCSVSKFHKHLYPSRDLNPEPCWSATFSVRLYFRQVNSSRQIWSMFNTQRKKRILKTKRQAEIPQNHIEMSLTNRGISNSK